MPWDYLDTPAFQTRFGIVAAYLQGKISGKVIMDLNCGRTAALSKYLKGPYKNYIGNDIALETRDMPLSIRILGLSDSKMLDWLRAHVENVDILLHLGYGGYDLSGEEAESSTELESGTAIVEYFRPELVILESVKKFIDHMKKRYEEYLENEYQVEDIFRLDINSSENDFVTKRVFYVYKKKSG